MIESAKILGNIATDLTIRIADASQKTLTISSTHGKESHVRKAYERITLFFNKLKAIAPQLTPIQCWYRILSEAMKKYLGDRLLHPPDLITNPI